MARNDNDLLGWRPANKVLPEPKPYPPRQAKTRAGSFGARACRALRVRLFTQGRASLPPSFAASNWIVARIRATVPWADFKKIREVYREADRLTVATGIKHHVDHVIPLNHPRVCGLHVDNNLRAIPAGANMAKQNDWCPEQLELFDQPEQLSLFR